MYLFDRECIEGVKEENSQKIFFMGEELFSDGEIQDAIEYYRLSAAMGDVNAINRLGMCYFDGKGVKRDFSISRAYFKLGVTKGNVNSLYRLGDFYMEGLGVERDERKAVEYYVEAYNIIKSSDDIEKYPELLYRLAKVFMEGKLLEQNLSTAYQFFCVALEEFRTKVENNGDEQAYKYIKSIKTYLKELKKSRQDKADKKPKYNLDIDEDDDYLKEDEEIIENEEHTTFENDYFTEEPGKKYIDDDDDSLDINSNDNGVLNINFFGKGSY